MKNMVSKKTIWIKESKLTQALKLLGLLPIEPEKIPRGKLTFEVLWMEPIGLHTRDQESIWVPALGLWVSFDSQKWDLVSRL